MGAPGVREAPPALPSKPLGYVLAAGVALLAVVLKAYPLLRLLALFASAALFFALRPAAYAPLSQRVGAPFRRSLLTTRASPSTLPAPGEASHVLVGAGLSSLTCAALLARLGHKVLVLEQHDIVGGGTHSYELGTRADGGPYKFDSGLHYTIPESELLVRMCTGQPDSEGCKVSLMGVRESEVPDWAGGPKKAANGAANGHHPAKPIDFSPGATNEEPIVYERVVIGSPKAEAFLFSLWQRHVPNLYKRFPNLKADIDRYVKHASGAVNSIPMFVLSKLFPLWLQRIVNPYLLKTFRYYAGMTTEEAFEHITDKTELRNLLSSLWMDIGAPPARGTFTLTAAVVWGFPQRGGAYPAGGSEELAKSLVRTIERYGGRVLVKADVAEILVEPEGSGFRAAGVKLRDGTEIRAPNVVSSVGYANTWSKLVPERVTSKLGIPRTLSDRVGPSAGFVMANIGLRASREEMGLQCYNTWYLPVDGSGDTFPAIRANFADPLGCDVPCMITFPSIKDRAWAEKDRETCQILVMVDGEPHFSKWLGKDSGKPGEDNEAYEALKKRWGDVLTERLLSLFPKMKREHVALVDISTPATIQYYLREPEGGAVGLDQTPRRFTDPAVQELLDMSTPVRGLWQTGQDTLICGQPLVQLAGAITAFRMMGFWKAAGLLLQTSLWELEGDGEEKK